MGIYHGDESGHVVVYHNTNIIIIDFCIFQSKAYTIQYNDSLITISIQKDGSKFQYLWHQKSLIEKSSLLDKIKKYLEGISRWAA